MATLKNHKFGSVMIMENQDHDDHLVRLNFSCELGNNFSYSHFINSILDKMQADNEQELFIEWCRGVDLDSGLIIHDLDGKMLDTNASDFNDHTRSAWQAHCDYTY